MFDKNSVLYKSLSKKDLEVLGRHSKMKVLGKRQYLCEQNTPAHFVYTIASGCAVAERVSSVGRRQVLSFIFPGDLVGLSEQYDFGVKSLTPLTAHQFDHQKLHELAETLPLLGENLHNIRKLVLSMMLDQLYLLGQKKALERLCFLFIHLLERLPDANVSCVELPMTRLDIADYLGLTVETVSRSMTKLKNTGLIDILGPHSIAIKNLDRVSEMGVID
ncbi:MAG: Crp/Fnr family transcriptional regulator [Gammaproteobacteria bacterium]